MRLSVDRGHAGLFLILMDGADLRNCYAADDVGGWADCFAEDKSGIPIVHEGSLVCIRKRGRVQIVPIPATPQEQVGTLKNNAR